MELDLDHTRRPKVLMFILGAVLFFDIYLLTLIEAW